MNSIKRIEKTTLNKEKDCFLKWVERILWLVLILIITRDSYTQNKQVNPKTIEIKAVAGLQYDVVRFKVRPGERVKIILRNEDDMAHNLVVVRPGTRLKVVNAAMQLNEKGPELNYVPQTEDVLKFVPVISPGQVKSVTFIAPVRPGIYPYVCTYPGHGFVMYGAMYVMKEGYMPDIRKDANVPEERRKEDAKNKNETKIGVNTLPGKDSGKNSISAQENKTKSQGAQKPAEHTSELSSPHPYPLTPPYWYHAMVDGVSPGAMVVRLPQDLSYCWDNEACRLKIAWKGDFIDMGDLWKGHFNASAKILGDIFWRDESDFPIRIGTDKRIPSTVQYKGYRLVNQYPEFHYQVDGMDVFELIREQPDGNGLVREFRIPNAVQPLWFFIDKKDNSIEYKFSAGREKEEFQELPVGDSRSFRITMTSYYLAYKYKRR